MKNIDVSFCVIAYNHAAYIDRALESISEQAFCGTLEVIIGVDHSKDSTLSEVRKCIEKYNFGGEVFVIAHEHNVGGCENYRSVHSRARGSFVAHLDGDDFFASRDKTQVQLDLFREHPDVSVSFTGRHDDKNESTFSGKKYTYSSLVKLLKVRKGGDFHSSKMYRRINDFQYPNFDFIDKELHLIHSAGGRIGYVDLPLTYYRPHTGVSRNRSLVRRLFRKAIKNNLKYLTINDRVYLEYMAYTEFFSLLNEHRRYRDIKRLLRTRFKYNFLIRLKLIAMNFRKYK